METPTSPDPRHIFGSTVRDIRLRKGISQERLADLCELHRTYIGGIERGERNVSLLNIVRIAAALEVHPAELFVDFDRATSSTGD
jgi:transcriptional regulator with XRE-family HTH domain